MRKKLEINFESKTGVLILKRMTVTVSRKPQYHLSGLIGVEESIQLLFGQSLQDGKL